MDQELKEYLMSMLAEIVTTGNEMLAEGTTPDPGLVLEVENAREALEKLKLITPSVV